MKHLIHNFFKKNYISLGILALVIIFVWLAGPWIVIANQNPLQSIDNRLYIIGFALFIWMLHTVFLPHPKIKSLFTPKTSAEKKKVYILNGRFKGAIKFLKKTQIIKFDKNITLNNLPWCLLIGPEKSGKTSLLANANVNYVLTKQFKHEKIIPSDLPDWWVTRDLIIVDTPGIYLAEKNNYLWENFLHHVQSETINSITIAFALPLPEILKQETLNLKKQIIFQLKHIISSLYERLGKKLSFYFIITKCDLVPGFVEFFNEGSIEESTQAWGVTLPIAKENENVVDIFSQRFNSLVKRLNNQLIYRLHQERNIHSRPAIKDFPLHIERLKDLIIHSLKSLNMPQLRLQGVYLTSATQHTVDEKTQANHSATHQTLQSLYNPPLSSRPYFLKQLILHGLQSTAEPQSLKSNSLHVWLQRSMYACAIGTILLSALLLGRDFQQSVLLTYSVQNQLAQYQLSIQQNDQEGGHLMKALPLLDALQSTTAHTDNNTSRFVDIISIYSDKSQKNVSAVYQQALQTIVLPEIKKTLEDYLQNKADKNPVNTYQVLSAYLMLRDIQNLQVDKIVDALKNVFPSFGSDINQSLLNHVHAAFNQLQQPIELNDELIKKVRMQMLSLPAQDLAFILLRNMNNNSANDMNLIFSNSSIFISKQANQIPNLFTENYFSKIISDELPVAATEALQGNNVLGKPEILTNEATINLLIQQLRARYIANYVSAWENLLNNLVISTPTNLAQTDAMITSLMGNTSPLLQLLNVIKRNTAMAPIMSASSKLQAINELLANAHNAEENNLYQVFVGLRQLHFYLQNILTASDPRHAAFDAAASRMQDPVSGPITQLQQLAEKSPEPIQKWLHSLASQSWNYILLDASQHIEQAWQLNILPIYRSQIHGNQELDIQQFANFVGKQGTFANFYQQYLKPFVLDNAKTWQWRVVDNQQLPFSNAVLSDLQHTSQLQKFSKYALFTQARNNPDMQNFKLPEKLGA